MASQHLFTNSLIKETSPYLLQHAHNPVNWLAWSDAALEQAKAQNKVILVSIGYSACHWCHVMERESFENESVAAVMNHHFINIKIDREERPDLDHLFMDAVQAIAGQGGWPLNVFLTPEGKPFFGGTYYPPVKAFNRPSWTDVLQGIAQAWAEKKHEIEAQADNLLAHLSQNVHLQKADLMPLLADGEKLFSIDQCHTMFTNIMKSADKAWGGFGKAPKFPQTFTIQYLLQYHHFTHNAEALQQALLSLDKMLEGGIYDHIAGGLARYSTDAEWLAPHFEKMLYDNALLIEVLCEAWQITQNAKYKAAIQKTALFIQTELMQEQGGFYAALDADSEGEEGKYYVWQKQEIDDILGDDAALFCAFYDVTTEGNWEATTILRILEPAPVFAAHQGLELVDFENKMKQCLAQLAIARSQRVKPSLDDKVILSWNALALKALAKAALVLNDQSLQQLAQNNFDFIDQYFRKSAGSVELMHTYKNGIAKHPAFLDDYAYLIAACIQLYELNFDLQYLEQAKTYADYVIENFSDSENCFFYFTSRHQGDILVRKLEQYDGAMPSSNSMMAVNLAKLAIIFDLPEWTTRAHRMLAAIAASVEKYPSSFGIWASLLLQQAQGMVEIAVLGAEAIVTAQKIGGFYIPNKVIMASSQENNNYLVLKNKNVPQRATQIYFCQNYTCLKPFESINDLSLHLNLL